MTQAATARGVLVLSPGAGSMNPKTEARLREAFGDHAVLVFKGRRGFLKNIPKGARVVVAGGDGTIGFVARELVDTDHPLGILSLGTYNNFARSLGLPTELGAAIDVIRKGRPRPITMGRVNGIPFLEVAAVGLFGEAISLGEAAKDRAFGHLRERLRAVTGARPFHYQLSGDLDGEGDAMSLVFANTPSTGAQMPIAAKTPEDPFLELSVHAGSSPTDIVGRILASSVLQKHVESADAVFRFRQLEVTTRPRAAVYADNAKAGRTPATVTAEVGALHVILGPR